MLPIIMIIIIIIIIINRDLKSLAVIKHRSRLSVQRRKERGKEIREKNIFYVKMI